MKGKESEEGRKTNKTDEKKNKEKIEHWKVEMEMRY